MLDLAVRNGAHAIDIEIETAEAAQDRLSAVPRARAGDRLLSQFEATPPMDTVVSRVMQVPADAYKMVTTARKPSDNVRVLAAAKALPKQRLIVLAMGELGFPDARALAGVRRRVHVCRADVRRGHRRRAGERARPAASLPRGEAREDPPRSTA